MSHGEERSDSLVPTSLKGTLSPAQVANEYVDYRTSNNNSPAHIPRDYFSIDTTLHDYDSRHTQPFAKVSQMLHRTVESHSNTPGSPNGLIASPMSSTDSLSSLFEKQQRNKINHPSHQGQLFTSNHSRSSFAQKRKKSSISIFNLLSPSSPLAKSSNVKPASNPQLSTTRKLEPSFSNPHHIHSSPNVKESRTVHLEYDPVSRKKVLNSYELIKEIGRGEHGKVKLAKNLNTNELVAIKIVDRKSRPKLGRSLRPNSSQEGKIRREIAIMKKINHPNVVQLKEVLDDLNSRKIYLVLEYLEKGEVKWQKAPNVPLLTLPESMKVFRDVVLGLEYLHYQGIIHRDIKPANLLISADGSVKISDFGVSFASSLQTGEQDDHDLAKTAGTPAFFAPEICEPIINFMKSDENLASKNDPDHDDDDHGSQSDKHTPKITYKIDIWALGITLYCFLFGVLPFRATNEFELFKVIYGENLQFPKSYPTNYEWTEEDKFEAKNLLFKILNKDHSKRLSIKEIKTHPLVLRNLSVEEARIFTEDQKACDHKIQVSNDEVQVAVTGIAGKLRNKFAKAFRFATNNLRPSISNNNISTSSAQSVSTDTDAKSPLVDETDSTKSLSKSNSLSRTRRALSNDTPRHRRVKSGDVAIETKATVEGDLFLNTESAFNSLNHIINKDKTRSNLNNAFINNDELYSDTFTLSNESSFSNKGSKLVSLPVNASFASLDSVYLDNYAPAYAYKNTQGLRDGKANFNKKTDDKFSKLNNFTLNQTTKKASDEAIPPHEKSKFDLCDDDDDNDGDDDNDDEDDTDDDYDDDEGLGFFVRPRSSGTSESNDQISEVSLPSIIAGELQDETPSSVELKAVIYSTPLKTFNKTEHTGPKYSFFETSDDSNSETDTIDTSRTEEEEIEEIDDISYHDDDQESDTDHYDSESEEELTFSFGNRARPRFHSVAITPKTPSGGNTPTRDTLSRTESLSLKRVSSPLSKNAPKTPIANSDAHLFVNHYKKTKPHLFPDDRFNYGNGGVSDNELGTDTTRGRSNSITMGILGNDRQQRQKYQSIK